MTATENINEKASVIAVFGYGMEEGLRPVKFKWRGREFKVDKINYKWRRKEGRTTFEHFSLATDRGLYELSYNLEDLSWQVLSFTEDY